MTTMGRIVWIVLILNLGLMIGLNLQKNWFEKNMNCKVNIDYINK